MFSLIVVLCALLAVAVLVLILAARGQPGFAVAINATASATATVTETVAPSPTLTQSPTKTASATLTPVTPSPTSTVALPSITPTPSRTQTLTPTVTASATMTSSPTPTANECVDIVSDSNGYGQITIQIPTTGATGVISVHPLRQILSAQLHDLNLDRIQILDRSLTAASITNSGQVDYFASSAYKKLIADHCRYVIVGPFLADVLLNQSPPTSYTDQMAKFVNSLLGSNSNTVLFILNFYPVSIPQFVKDLPEFAGLNTDRIEAFNARLTQECVSTGALGRVPQVVCVDVQGLFADMGNAYVLTSIPLAQYQAILDLTRPTKVMSQVQAYFQQESQGKLIGDGFHLSLEGRIRLMNHIATLIAEQEKKS